MLVPRLLRTRDAAELIRISESYLRVLRMTGKIKNRMTPPPHVVLGTERGGIRYDIRDLEKWTRKYACGGSFLVSEENVLTTEKVPARTLILLKTSEAANYLGVSYSYIRQIKTLTRLGNGAPPPPYIMMGGKTTRYELCALDEWIDSLPRRWSMEETERAKVEYEKTRM